MAELESTPRAWRTSSYSGNHGGNCVEVGVLPRGVAVRDSQDRHGPMLRFTPVAWSTFLARLTTD